MWVTPLLFIFIPFPLLYIKRVGRKGSWHSLAG